MSNIGFIELQLRPVGSEHRQARVLSFRNGGYDGESDIVLRSIPSLISLCTVSLSWAAIATKSCCVGLR
jgi:hypothetical protein